MFDEFQLSVATVADDVALVCVGGELDLFTAPRLREGVDEAVRSGRATVLVDLSGVTFIDSTALGVLVHKARSLRGRARSLAVVANDPRTLRVFEITGLARLFAIHPTVYDALAETAAERRRAVA